MGNLKEALKSPKIKNLLTEDMSFFSDEPEYRISLNLGEYNTMYLSVLPTCDDIAVIHNVQSISMKWFVKMVGILENVAKLAGFSHVVITVNCDFNKNWILSLAKKYTEDRTAYNPHSGRHITLYIKELNE